MGAPGENGDGQEQTERRSEHQSEGMEMGDKRDEEQMPMGLRRQGHYINRNGKMRWRLRNGEYLCFVRGHWDGNRGSGIRQKGLFLLEPQSP